MKNIILASLFSILLCADVYAEEKAPPQDAKTSKMVPMEMTAAQREEMAKMHEGIATCLRSTKSMGDCKKEMKAAHEGMEKGGCPMMHEKGECPMKNKKGECPMKHGKTCKHHDGFDEKTHEGK